MLLIYIPEISSRIEYIFNFIFKYEWSIEYSTTSDLKAFENYKSEKINYSASKHGNEFFIKAFTLLSENSIEKKNPNVAEKYETKILFPNNKLCDLGFDIFSAIFYMVSRYEEYLPFTPDQHGRFKASDSLAIKHNFLQIPVVNIWINIFKKILQKKYPLLQIKSTTFNAILTYDIDVAYKFKGRNLLRTIGSSTKDLLKFDLKNIFQRGKTLFNGQKDPWDVYDYLWETILKNNLDSVFFFLLADNSTNDRNLSHENQVMKRLINKIKTFSEIGIHPSYKSSLFPEKILIEKERLEKITNKKIIKSRQHFLKFILPETYNSLLNAGITEEYSMVFPSMPGFRAGTCRSFYFYDLKNEKATRLKIFPVTMMEGSFINNKTGLNESSQQILDLIKEVKKVNGTFISIWHNDTISETAEYRDWKNIHDQMIRAILEIHSV
ncbi:MAG: polysaccharide deacetylase family protein [Bacteroidota bacterium]|nr:polysaccharide deacetylase family protein [Bacteroidota bacterium]